MKMRSLNTTEITLDGEIISRMTPLGSNEFIESTFKPVYYDDHHAFKLKEKREQKTENRKQKTENRKQRTVNRKQKTENRKQKTENRKQKTENRKQKTENRKQ